MSVKVLHVSSGKTIQVTLARCRARVPDLEPHFALCFEGRLSRELSALGAPIHRLGGVRASKPLTIWRARRRLSALLRRHAFDAVICHAAWPQAMFGPTIKNAGVPLVLWLLHPPNANQWLDRWALSTEPDFVLCNSRFTADVFRKGYGSIPNQTIHCPVFASPSDDAADDRTTIRRELQTSLDATVVIQVSRVPVITTAKGGALEIVDETCGSLVPDGDFEGLVRTLEQFVRDPLLRARKGAPGPARARELCEPYRQTEQLRAVLRQVVVPDEVAIGSPS